MVEINRDVARKVIETVDAGLCAGIGSPAPGQMCVEAAVCYALGLPHGDDPQCVAPSLRTLKITLNDTAWSSPAARAKGMRKLALLQLGTRDLFDEKLFLEQVVEMTARKVVPRALRLAAEAFPSHGEALEAAAADAADAAKAAVAAYAAKAADIELEFFAEEVAQILIRMNVPAVAWLDLLD